MNKSVVIQIGNSDDKLTQLEWSCFVKELRSLVDGHKLTIRFWGAPANYEQWQNLCCVCDVPMDCVEVFLDAVRSIRERWYQDAAAVIVGDTKFI